MKLTRVARGPGYQRVDRRMLRGQCVERGVSERRGRDRSGVFLGIVGREQRQRRALKKLAQLVVVGDPGLVIGDLRRIFLPSARRRARPAEQGEKRRGRPPGWEIIG